MRHAPAALAVLLLTSALGAAEPKVVDLWPGKAPGETSAIAEEKLTKDKNGVVTSITNVSKPTISVYRPEREKDSGVAIVVCPGGGYSNLAWDHEGEQVARWLNSIGVSAYVLKYRVPRRPDTPKDKPPTQPLMDAQRAVSLVRAGAADAGIDPKRIGILGFSAGGHLAAAASTNSETRAYEAVDASDKASCRPDFAVLVYPGGVVERNTIQLTPEIKIGSQTPPMFLAHANNDPVSPENSVAIYLALKRAGVPAEMHIYGSGGHGFGMRPGPKPSSSWPARCEEWLRDQGVLKAKPAS